MPTLNQLMRRQRQPKHHIKTRENCAVTARVIKLATMSPKKPNSAVRKGAKVRLERKQLRKVGNGPYIKTMVTRIIFARSPGQGYACQDNDEVLLINRKPADCPGVKKTIVRGAFKKGIVETNRLNKRSKYGVKRPDSKKKQVAKK